MKSFRKYVLTGLSVLLSGQAAFASGSLSRLNVEIDFKEIVPPTSNDMLNNVDILDLSFQDADGDIRVFRLHPQNGVVRGYINLPKGGYLMISRLKTSKRQFLSAFENEKQLMSGYQSLSLTSSEEELDKLEIAEAK